MGASLARHLLSLNRTTQVLAMSHGKSGATLGECFCATDASGKGLESFCPTCMDCQIADQPLSAAFQPSIVFLMCTHSHLNASL